MHKKKTIKLITDKEAMGYKAEWHISNYTFLYSLTSESMLMSYMFLKIKLIRMRRKQTPQTEKKGT